MRPIGIYHIRQRECFREAIQWKWWKTFGTIHFQRWDRSEHRVRIFYEIFAANACRIHVFFNNGVRDNILRGLLLLHSRMLHAIQTNVRENGWDDCDWWQKVHWAYGIPHKTGHHFPHQNNEVIETLNVKQQAIAKRVPFLISAYSILFKIQSAVPFSCSYWATSFSPLRPCIN